MRWLVLGSRGMFGSDMLEFLKTKNENVTGLNSAELDLTQNIQIIDDKIKDFDVVINATAFTNVNLAETEQQKAFELNAEVPKKLSEITAANNQKLLHISTDYVFDGTKETPYLKTDSTNPINVYGQSKLAGEKHIQDKNPNGLIIRTSWLYGPNGHCFPKAIINKLKNNQPVEVVDDQFGTPTSTWFLREFCHQLALTNPKETIHHGVPTGITSWHGFATEIAKDFNKEIKPIKTTKQIAPRPKNSQLEPEKQTDKTWKQCWDEIKTEFV